MKSKRLFHLVISGICFIIIIAGCGKEEKPKTDIGQAPKTDLRQPAPQTTSPPSLMIPAPTTPIGPVAQPAVDPAKPASPTDVIVEVDGAKMTQGQIDAELKKKMAALKEKIPANKLQQVKASMKRKIAEDFIVRTLLSNEVKRRKIPASDKELADGMEQIKSGLPPGMTLDDLMKRNKVSKEQMSQELILGIKVKKLVATLSGKKKPTDKEVSDFYKKNKDKFKTPETARASHILIAGAPGDDAKIKTEKKAKAEDIRKQLLAGANFADLAAKYSDCPSKNSGGDLGVFSRGQMVKPFDDAAFSWKINEIGPVVETEFGYHVIKVTERNAPAQMPLDKDVKDKISGFLVSKKEQETFIALVKQLKEKANIIVYRQP
jgi:peptidyl-prolyl cis-trans isomerase C